MVPFQPESNFVQLGRHQIQLEPPPAFTNDQVIAKHTNSNSESRTQRREHSYKPLSISLSIPLSIIPHRRKYVRRSPSQKLECPFCGKLFAYRGNMVVHIRVHTGEKKFKCDTCMKRFSKRQNLQSHKRVHTGEQPFKCHICGKAFARQNNLSRHVNIHSGKRPYQCEVCEKRFVSTSNLRSHLVIHGKRTIYHCEYCLKRFKSKAYFKKHVQVHKDSGDKVADTTLTQISIEQNEQVQPQATLGEIFKEEIVCGIPMPASMMTTPVMIPPVVTAVVISTSPNSDDVPTKDEPTDSSFMPASSEDSPYSSSSEMWSSPRSPPSSRPSSPGLSESSESMEPSETDKQLLGDLDVTICPALPFESIPLPPLFGANSFPTLNPSLYWEFPMKLPVIEGTERMFGSSKATYVPSLDMTDLVMDLVNYRLQKDVEPLIDYGFSVGLSSPPSFDQLD